MHLAPGERAILSYYSSHSQAEQAVQELKESGFGPVEIEKIPRSGLFSDSLGWYTRGIAGLTQAVAEPPGESPLTPGPGLQWTADGPWENHTYMITLVVDQQHVNRTLSIVRKYASIVN